MFVVPKRESNCLNGVGKQRNTKKLLYCYPFVYLQALFMAMLHTKTITESFDSEIASLLAKLKGKSLEDFFKIDKSAGSLCHIC